MRINFTVHWGHCSLLTLYGVFPARDCSGNPTARLGWRVGIARSCIEKPGPEPEAKGDAKKMR
ncbi:hypothetical protein DMA11_08135 [Marinilabiliaceae bacterium JC017]|nr:hypothetical protein DMA11_08135 [Marinilabiliaceae bacterium JC017]